jgi:hypothetical protein
MERKHPLLPGTQPKNLIPVAVVIFQPFKQLPEALGASTLAVFF